jgi:hypothetical protein
MLNAKKPADFAKKDIRPRILLMMRSPMRVSNITL